MRLVPVFGGHDRWGFVGGQLIGGRLGGLRGLGGGLGWGFEVGIEIAILGPQREGLAEQLGHAVSEADVVLLAVGAEPRTRL